MSNDPDLPFIEFLRRKENLRVAMQTSARLPKVILHVREQFIRDLQTVVRNACTSEIAEGWTLKEIITGDKRRYPGFCMLPPQSVSPRYVFRVELDSNLFHGIWAFGKPFTEDEFRQESFNHHRDVLYKEGFTVPPRPVYWMGWRYSAPAEDTETEAVLQLVERREEMIRLATESCLADFRQLQGSLSALNSSLMVPRSESSHP